MYSAGAYAGTRCNHLPETLATGDELSQFISACEITSVDQLIPKLPQSYRDRFTLMYQSRAEDEVKEPGTVTPLMPRAILFGGAGKLVLAFTSNPDKESFQDLQMLEFNGLRATTQFKTIRFQNNRAVYDKNPQSCKGCHGENQNPIWGAYPFWQGAYGSKHDLLNESEMAKFQSFLKRTQVDQSSRFRHLNQKNIVHQYTYREQQDFQSNFELTAILSNMVAAKIARAIEVSPQFLTLRNLLIWSAYQCANQKAGLASQFELDALIKQVKVQYSASITALFEQYLPKESTREDSIPDLFDQLDPTIFTHHLTRNSFEPRFLTGLGFLEETAVNQVAKNAGFDVVDSQNYGLPDLLFRLAQANPISGNVKIKQNAVCKQLSDSLHQGTWFGATTAQTQNLIRGSEPRASTDLILSGAFKKCIRCHTGASPVGSLIPFDDELSMKTRIKNDPSLKTKIISEIESGRMPFFEAKLTEPEQTEIRNYLMRISP